MYGARIVGYI